MQEYQSHSDLENVPIISNAASREMPRSRRLAVLALSRPSHGTASPVAADQTSQTKDHVESNGGGLAAMVAFPQMVKADDDRTESPNDPFIVLLHGIYQPVPAGSGPNSNLGLTSVNLSDGSYSATLIYPVYGIGGNTGEDNLPNKPIGRFYVQFGGGGHCAYDLPGGAIAMQFLAAPAGAPAGFNALSVR